LPQAAAEAIDVASLWTRSTQGEAAVLIVGQAASETTFKQSAAGRQFLHISTHGFFARSDCPSPQQGPSTSIATDAPGAPNAKGSFLRTLPSNPLLDSGLALAGANQGKAAASPEDDGLLTAAEVATLDLTAADWVVLSACGSGLGPVQPGEGVLSLQRAFATAGAGTVVMTLWSVEDRPTRQWMRALYEARLTRGLHTAQAIRAAHNTLLSRLRQELGAAPPALWAPFVASGNWQ
jgi:CHAT domain-containing protein